MLGDEGKQRPGGRGGSVHLGSNEASAYNRESKKGLLWQIPWGAKGSESECPAQGPEYS